MRSKRPLLSTIDYPNEDVDSTGAAIRAGTVQFFSYPISDVEDKW